MGDSMGDWIVRQNEVYVSSNYIEGGRSLRLQKEGSNSKEDEKKKK